MPLRSQLKSRQLTRALRTGKDRREREEKKSEYMGSREKDQTTPHHQPLLSSLVVRPSVSDGAGDGGRGGAGSDYEPGEVRREPPSYYRSDRYPDDPALNVACKNLGLEEGMLV